MRMLLHNSVGKSADFAQDNEQETAEQTDLEGDGRRGPCGRGRRCRRRSRGGSHQGAYEPSGRHHLKVEIK